MHVKGVCMASGILVTHMLVFSYVHFSLVRAGPVVWGNHGAPVVPGAFKKSNLRNSSHLSCQGCFLLFTEKEFWLAGI